MMMKKKLCTAIMLHICTIENVGFNVKRWDGFVAFRSNMNLGSWCEGLLISDLYMLGPRYCRWT